MLISTLKEFRKGRDFIRPGVTRFAMAYVTLTCLHWGGLNWGKLGVVFFFIWSALFFFSFFYMK